MNKFICLIFALVTFTALIIICSFLNLSSSVPFITKISLLNEEIPIILSTLYLAGSLLIYLLIAFVTSKNSYNKYRNELIGFNISVPIILVLTIFPNSESLTYNVDQRYNLLLFGNLFLHALITKFLAPQLWVLGGRKIET
ncbi:hypothetical protein [Pseudoalteromonas rhizosphaerae]|uniref:hypothetical protein n=1 Tax=Pseudoalteromonas rhizosphaerae TaxID=2518973 RepID=UPI00123031E3|nr:hypothetical protein [Pseudoalteromonas rhizosphaerae]